MPRRPSPSDVFYATFAGAAGRAAIFELKARVLVDAIPELSGSMTDGLEDLIRKLAAWTEREGLATADDREKLRRCAKLRNKLFHAAFNRVAGQLDSLDVELDREHVKRFTFGTGPLTIEGFDAALRTGGEPVSKTKMVEGRMFGWLIEAHRSGAFGAAGATFDEGVDLLHQILDDYWTARLASTAPT
jgi:hypothetical protein